MKKIISFFVLLFLICCKTGPDSSLNDDDPTKLQINDNMDKDQLRMHMRTLFNLIEDKIAKGNFEGWYNSISKNYKKLINDRLYLNQLSEMSDFLYNRKIKLKTPLDYFEYVVIKVREGKSAKFKDYKYIDKNHIKVICSFDKEGDFEYNFIYEDGHWKIDR